MDGAPTTAAGLLRQARRRAGLSQVTVAARAGVPQSVISAYETGRRQPALPTLMALVEATGHELAFTLRRGRLARLSGPLGRRLRRHRHEVLAAAAACGVSNLRVFGSVARGEDRADSDVDLLVDAPAELGLVGMLRLQGELESILGARVDLVPAPGLKAAIRARVERDLVAL